MFGFGELDSDFDYDGNFDFTTPVARKTTGRSRKSDPFDFDDLDDLGDPEPSPMNPDPHDFWRHEPTRSMPRVGQRRKPSARSAKPPRASKTPRASWGRTTRTRAATRSGGTRQHGDPTQQIPVIDDDGVIVLDDTACRPFDAETGLGGQNPGRVRTHAAPFGGDKNPLLRRVGAMFLLLSLGVPVAMAMRGEEGRSALSAAQANALAAAQAQAQAEVTVAASVDAAAGVDTPLVTAGGAVTVDAQAGAGAAGAAGEAPAAQPVAEVPPPVCVKTYTVVVGDGWLRIANAHSVTMNELLASNNANVSSFLMVGAEICVPANATDPTTTVKTTTPAVTTPAAVYVPPFSLACSKSYVVVLGDGWLRIANKHNVTMKELLAVNAASSSTLLLVGKKICVPANATTPTVSTPTTVKVKTPRPPPTPTLYPPTRTYTAAEVEAIIREVWPDDLEEEALRIAKRESRLNPRAQNYCCYGLFQIYYNVHKKWLAEMGVTSGEQLLDPTVAAKAGLKLYQRNGWGPWKL